MNRSTINAQKEGILIKTQSAETQNFTQTPAFVNMGVSRFLGGFEANQLFKSTLSKMNKIFVTNSLNIV